MYPYHPPPLAVPGTAPPRTATARWFREGERLDAPQAHGPGDPWYRVLWLTGVDYFSTLGYQPGLALLAAGAISPIATLLLIALTLFGALPIYAQVAKRSYAGQGSIAMLESLLGGWSGKLLVLALLGFAATDFIITITLSAADAAEHAVHNPLLHPYLGGGQLPLTLGLITLLAVVFLKGFKEALGVAMLVGVPYIVLNGITIGRGIWEVMQHPEAWSAWQAGVALHGSSGDLLLAAVIIFPRLALGMSGFETGVSVMPLVQGGPRDTGRKYPAGRVRATRKMLAAAAFLMCGLLLGSSLVTAVLIPPEAYATNGPAAGRAIAYLAHELLGPIFGTAYDAMTILILWFAGASAMAGLLNLVPRYLPRFGMAPHWIAYRRPLVVVLFSVAVAVTWIFDANVEAQGGAYATGVLVLMLSAAVAVSLALWREFRHAGPLLPRLKALVLSGYFWLVTGVFVFTLVDNVIERSDGVIIASVFIVAIVVLGGVSRAWRAMELRATELTFHDDPSIELWKSMLGKKVNLVPLRTASAASRLEKAAEIRRYYQVTGPLAFVHVELLDNRSEFLTPLTAKVTKEGDDFVLEITGATAVANAIAYISELIDPISLFVGLTQQNLMSQSIKYLLWGEGETGLLLYMILVRYWSWSKEQDVRPLIFLMSSEPSPLPDRPKRISFLPRHPNH